MKNNKIQRLITVILTIAFAISVMNFQVFAFKVGEELPETEPEPIESFEIDLFKLEDYPSSITLSLSSCMLKPGENTYISYTMSPMNTGQSYLNIVWSSSNPNVAAISSDTTHGLSGGITIYGISGGTATISATTKNGITSSCFVTVESEPTSIEVAPSYAQMQIGETLSLSATVFPTDVANKNVTYRSSDGSVASVDQYGTVTAKKGGTAIITVSTYNNITESCTINVKSEPTSISLNTHNVSLEVNQEASLSYTIEPADVQNTQVTWSSSNSNVASVDQYGTVVGRKAGTATITVTTSNGKSDNATVTVKKAAPQSITLSASSKTLTVGYTDTLKATISPTDAKDDPITWSSDNPSVASVDSNGKITAKSAGSANITVTTSNGLTATCRVTVKAVEPTSISLSTTSHTMNIGDTFTLSKTIKPDKAKDDKVTWASSNISVATVSDGTITAKAAGTATITATTSNGITARCEITVKAIEPTSITVSPTTKSVGVGDTFTLSVTIKPAEAQNDKLTWSSSKASVATVDSNGTVTAKAEGTATITVKTSNGKTATCEVTVKAVEPTDIALSASSHTMTIGEELTLKTTIKPDGAKDEKLTWTSSNTSVATVNGGVVTAKAVGTTTVTVKTANGLTATCAITVEVPKATSVTVSPTSSELEIGETAAVKATVQPSAAEQSVTWSTSDSNIAAVSTSGIITAKSTGTATITAKTSNGKTATCKVTVKAIEATSVALSATSKELEAGKSFTLYATIAPSNTTDKSVTWKSSDTGVATVSDGKVTAKSSGTAAITATTVNGKTATCTITVPEKSVTAVEIEQENTELNVGDTITLSAKVTPADAANKDLTWFSNNEDVATITSDGLVTAKSVGNATMTAKSESGKIDTCIITVVTDASSFDFKFTTDRLSIRVGETKALDYEPIPEGTKVDFTIVGEDGIISIDDDYNVTGLKPGTAIVGARIGNGKRDSIQISVGSSYEQEEAARKQFAEDVLYYVNIEREKAGLAPVQLMDELSEKAQVRTDEQVEAGMISHTRPDGTEWFTVLNGSSIKYWWAAENLIMGYNENAEECVQGWMNSEKHRKNILNEKATHMGIGVEFTDGTCEGAYIATQLFIKQR